MNDRVSISIEAGVADVRLIRADKMNAFDDAMFAGIIEAGAQLAATPGLRAVVLSGEGRAFCAGLDMSKFGEMASGERGAGDNGGTPIIAGARTPNGANRAQQVVMLWRELAVPVIAAVHGVAFGAGFQLALGADLRFVTPDARFAAFEMNWGLVPDMAGIALLRGLVRDDVARDLVYGARIVSGTEAAAIGLVTRVCADPLAEALAYAAEIAGRNPDAVRAAKRLLNLAQDETQSAILIAESDEQGRLIGAPNQVEAVNSRLAKRAGQFRD
ncbi:enoyl-CoA hydratase [Polymorphobacter glacialis]|uniref:Enoyl-CoA hydratase n=1 Tax=Sandarakinorhabdus glacialis TaxID=1614636 RepID=A0A917EAX0_9SPHN|nr:crotonase/enoyl-CoA hydratase family protein [Polymorphobacter glacialis]GGE17202.1 enoyl-CoA hydratase [Polymorphobacter glacialis]